MDNTAQPTIDGAAVAQAITRLEPVSPRILQDRDARLQVEGSVLELGDREDDGPHELSQVDGSAQLIDESAGEDHVVQARPELGTQVVVQAGDSIAHEGDHTAAEAS